MTPTSPSPRLRLERRLRALLPEGITRRFQLLCLALLLVYTAPVPVLLAVVTPGPAPLRAAGAFATVLVGWLWVSAYRRGGPRRADPALELVALVVTGLAVASTSSGASGWFGIVFMALVYRCFFGPGRWPAVWGAVYFAALPGLPVLAAVLGMEGFYERDLAPNVGALVVTGLFAWAMARSLRSHDRALRSERALREELAHRAHHDDLTGLANRALFFDRLEHALALARREETETALLFLDLDGFKGVNDLLGHGAGDELLRAVGRRLREQVRAADTVARIGGDEFVLLLEATSHEQGEAVAAQVAAALDAPVELAGRPIVPRGTVGVASVRAGASGADELLHAADQAMYGRKAERGAASAPRRAALASGAA